MQDWKGDLPRPCALSPKGLEVSSFPACCLRDLADYAGTETPKAWAKVGLAYCRFAGVGYFVPWRGKWRRQLNSQNPSHFPWRQTQSASVHPVTGISEDLVCKFYCNDASESLVYSLTDNYKPCKFIVCNMLFWPILWICSPSSLGFNIHSSSDSSVLFGYPVYTLNLKFGSPPVFLALCPNCTYFQRQEPHFHNSLSQLLHTVPTLLPQINAQCL